MKIFALTFILIFLTGFAESQVKWEKTGVKIPPVVCYGSGKTEKSFIPPPSEFLLKKGQGKKSDFIITYSQFPDKGKPALEYAVSIWEQILSSQVPIKIKIIGKSLGTNILAQGGPSDYFANFEFAPHKNRYYPVVVAERITGKDINSTSSSDIEISFNKDILWYYGTDGQTPSELYDFVTVALHEIGHGLGFTGFFFVTGDKGVYGNSQIGDIAAFDIMVLDGINRHLIDTTFYQLATQKLYNAFTSQALFSESISAKNYSLRNKVRLYAPSTWSDGSSIYHLDDDTYPSSDENSLMTHAIGKGEAIHDPGPITRGILDDVGWKTMKLQLEKPKDIEILKPLVFKLKIESDNKIDSSNIFLCYSVDNFKTRDSVRFTLNKELSDLEVTINPVAGTSSIYYYVKAKDFVKRSFSFPSEAPEDLLQVKIGTDNESPVIEHTPIPYFVANGNKMEIFAGIDDNLGVDTAFVEFTINGVAGNTFGLVKDSATIYKGKFDVQTENLNDGDIIEYRIVAIDSSSSKNLSVNPVHGFYSFRVEKIFAPVKGYINDFNTDSPDFVLSDFEIYTAEGFQNGALQSPHPYPSPNQDNSTYNFITLLKYPIILQDGGIMSFDEVVLVEPGEVLSKFGDDNFWDYVIAEGSKNNGKTWLPLADGYDSQLNSIWEDNYNKNLNGQNSTTIGLPDWFVNHQISLLKNGNFKAGDTILIRFRLFSDPYAHGWGWVIDNLRIQTPLSTQEVQLSHENLFVYPNPFKDLLHVTFQNLKISGNVKIEVINLYGQTISEFDWNNISEDNSYTLNLRNLPEGMYLISVKVNGKRIAQQKIVKTETNN